MTVAFLQFKVERTTFPFWCTCLCSSLEGKVQIFFALRTVNCTKSAFIESQEQVDLIKKKLIAIWNKIRRGIVRVHRMTALFIHFLAYSVLSSFSCHSSSYGIIKFTIPTYGLSMVYCVMTAITTPRLTLCSTPVIQFSQGAMTGAANNQTF